MIAELRSQDVQVWADGDTLRCNGPKEVLTSGLMAELRSRKSDLLAFLRVHGWPNGSPGMDSTPMWEQIPPTDRNQPSSLSYAQERMWFLSRVDGNTAQTNQFQGFYIDGPLQVDVLERGLMAIEQRHHVLRTKIRTVEGVPMQVVSSSSSVRLPVLDLQQHADQDDAVKQVIRETAETPFDLEAGPLWRVRLLRLGPARHILLATMHHIICDGWSRGVLLNELAILYAAFSQGKACPLPKLSIQYADFAVWQRQRVPRAVLEQHIAYWKRQLAGAPPVLELPTDRSRPVIYRYRGQLERLEIPADITSGLERLSRRSRASLFMVLHAAFSVLLSRLTGSTDVIIGTPVANRTRPELEPLIGVFINNVVLRTDLSDNPSFVALLERVRRVALDGYAHQDLPFEQLLQALQPVRDPSYPPLFQVMFNLQTGPDSSLRIPKLTLTPIEAETHITDNFWHSTSKLQATASRVLSTTIRICLMAPQSAG